MRGIAARFLTRLGADRGITGVETGVVVGGLVLASSLVAGAVLNGGIAGSRQLDTAVQSALRQTTTGVQADGPVIARTDGAHATHVLIDLTTTAGGGAVDVGPPPAGDAQDIGRLVVSYVSSDAARLSVPYAVTWVSGDGDALLEPGEVAQVDVDLGDIASPPGASDRFSLELRAGDAPPLIVERTMPPGRPLDAVVSLW